jgi:hypothetical protein
VSFLASHVHDDLPGGVTVLLMARSHGVIGNAPLNAEKKC